MRSLSTAVNSSPPIATTRERLYAAMMIYDSQKSITKLKHENLIKCINVRNSLKRPIINSEIEFVIKKKKKEKQSPSKKRPGLEDFHGGLEGNGGSISGQGTRLSHAVEQLSLKPPILSLTHYSPHSATRKSSCTENEDLGQTEKIKKSWTRQLYMEFY